MLQNVSYFERLLDHLLAFAENKRRMLTSEIFPSRPANELVENGNLTVSQNGKPCKEIANFILEVLTTGITQTTSPRYFGLFNPPVLDASVVSDMLIGIYNPQLATIAGSPSLHLIDNFVLKHMALKFGYPEDALGQFTSGGSEANLTAIIAALVDWSPNFRVSGVRGLPAEPVIFVSSQTHASIEKAAKTVGLGSSVITVVKSDPSGRIDIPDLEKSILLSIDRGKKPLMVIATVGYPSSGAIDFVEEISQITSQRDIWLHIDAAWGGHAAFCSELKFAIKGIERSDSITTDPHKWLPVSRDVGVLLCRNKNALGDFFKVTPSYVPGGTSNNSDPYSKSLFWSRPARGLKVFATLQQLGEVGLNSMYLRNRDLAAKVMEKLTAWGWRKINESPLAVLCIVNEQIIDYESFCQSIWQRGQVWLSTVCIGKEIAIRICFNNINSSIDDCDVLVNELNLTLKKPRLPLHQDYLESKIESATSIKT